MPIFDQGYQHWQGTLAGHAWRWLAITHRGVRSQWGNKWTRRVVYPAIFPALALALLLVGWGLFEQKSTFLLPILPFIRGLPEEIRSGPRNFRLPIWTLAFDRFLAVQMFFSMILVLLVGPDLISQDLRFNAMPLYFSRPLRRWDYFLGKLGVIAVYLTAVTIVPILLAWGLGVAFSLDYHIVGETAPLLLASVAYGLIVVVSAGSFMLALSSLSKNSRFVGVTWVIFWVIGNLAAGVLTNVVRAPWCPLVSYVNNLKRIREVLLDTESAWEPITKIFEMGRPHVSAAKSLVDNTPWHWSAIVLAVLFGLSLWILSLRVRSLDRLK
jgi:ABC-2 type transport system permease protein